MATLKMDKATFMLVVTIWSLLAAYIGTIDKLSAGVLALVLGIGTAIILWLGVETGNEPEPTVTPTVLTP